MGWTLLQALDACTNLKAASKILGACYAKAQRKGARGQQALHDALSCYYSGNFKTGYEHGYVNKVRNSAGLQAQVPSITAPEQKNLPEVNTSRPLISSSSQQTRGLIFNFPYRRYLYELYQQTSSPALLAVIALISAFAEPALAAGGTSKR